MGASRFPGKPLVEINGVPLIGHCYHRTKMSKGMNDVYVATCDAEIADYIESIGGKSVMTSDKHNRATDRTAEAMLKIEEAEGKNVDVVVMVQGDEPLLHPNMLDEIVEHFENPEVNIVNLMSRLSNKEDFEDKNNVKVVYRPDGNALYFSREAIPSGWKGIDDLPKFMQVGIIAFRRETLIAFNQMPELPLEQIESVDMNRVLESGGAIKMVSTDQKMIGVDTPEEAAAVAEILKSDELALRY
jgi:3-deoxy-manno-octulosonate cytidylyltransferase (CMP-KDO synthetase)